MIKGLPRGKSRSEYPIKDLSYILAQGGRVRQHKFAREFRGFVWPVLVGALLQAACYIGLTVRFGRDDWPAILLAVAVLALVPLSAAGVLTALRRHGSPLITATIVSISLFSVAVSVLSAFRVPLSYQALAACLPVTILMIAYANVRFQRSFAAHVAFAAFPQANTLANEIGALRVIEDPAADLSGTEILLIDPLEHHSEHWSALLARCYLGGIEVMPWTSYVEVRRGRLDVSSFDISHLAYSPSQVLYARVKRAMDLLIILFALPILIPVAAAVALYIGIRDGWPVFFVQVRRGYGGRTFRMYKFRTMHKNTGGGATSLDDRRIIPGCGILRKLRLDELPQIYNILVGDMSLIGPRPEAIDLARNYERVIPKYPMRLLVLPGITGWAQVNSGYTSTPEEAALKLSYDLYYIKHLSLDLDLRIILRTFRTILLWAGAR